MARSSLTARNNYEGTGSVSTYAYGFPIAIATDLLITEEVIATGVLTTYVKDTDYNNITGVGDTAGGNFDLIAGNLPATKKITVRRKVPLTQATDIRNQGLFFPETHENEFDKRNDIAQQQQDEIDRCLILSETTDSSAFSSSITGLKTAGYVPTINGTADGMVWAASVAGSLTVPADLEFMVQTSSGVFTGRTLTAGTDITVTFGDGQSGDPVINTTLAATLALITNGNGASLIGVEDSAGNFAGATVEAVLAEIIADYALTTTGNGASKIGIEDSAGNLTATTVEAALAELYTTSENGILTVSGQFSGDATTNRTISTSIPAGSTLIKIEVMSSTTGQRRNTHVVGDLLASNQTAEYTAATTSLIDSGVDFKVGNGVAGINDSGRSYDWVVWYTLA